MPPKASALKAQGRKRSSNEAEPTAEKPSAAEPSAGAAAAMIDEGPEESGSDSGSPVAATPSSKKVKLAPAEGAAASPSVASELVSASSSPSSSSAPTPCGRLDADSLSVVFSFLNMQDFLRAVRVSRHWRAARVKRTAWPAFSLETMIQSLRDDDFDNPHRRKLEFSVNSGNARKFGALLRRPGMMDLWRHATEIKLVHDEGNPQARAGRAATAMLSLIPQFASLAALTLDGFALAPDAADPAIQLFDALSSRLLMLGLFRCSDSFTSQLHRLSSLRVLVLGSIPVADALLPLHQLVYLHIQYVLPQRLLFPPRVNHVGARLGYVIRWLSVHHALRSLSMEGFTADQAQGCLSALMSCKAADPRHVNLASLSLQPQLDRSVPCALTDLSILAISPATAALLNATPSLTRLQTSTERFHGGLHPALQLTLPRLQQLRFQGDAAFSNWDQLAHCTALRIVHLTHHWSGGMARATLQSLFSAWSATLEECRLDLVLTLEGQGADSGNEDWAELAVCRRLRLLDLRMEKEQALPAGLVAALQVLPSFHSLVLGFNGAKLCQLPPNLLSVMAQSNSFNTLHLHALSAGSRSPDFVQSAEIAKGRGLSAMLSALAENEPVLLTSQTINRLHVVGHRSVNGASRVHSYRIVQTDDQPAWHREY